MKNQEFKSPHTYKSSNKKCSECDLVSSTVDKSSKFNRNLCINCLCQLILNLKKS